MGKNSKLRKKGSSKKPPLKSKALDQTLVDVDPRALESSDLEKTAVDLKADPSNTPSSSPKLKSKVPDLEKTAVDLELESPTGIFLDPDKTSVDVDVRGLDETALVKLPGPGDDTGLFDDGFFDEEATRAHDFSEDDINLPKPEPIPVEKKIPEAMPKKSDPPSSTKSEENHLVSVEKPQNLNIADKKPVPLTSSKPVKAKASKGISIAFFILALPVLAMLIAGFIGAFKEEAPLQIPAGIALGLGCLVLIFLTKKWIQGKIGFLLLLTIWFGYIAYSGFLYSSLTSPYFLQLSLAEFIGPAYATISTTILLFLIFTKDSPILAKMVAFLGWFCVVMAVAIALLQGSTIEGAVWRPALGVQAPLYLRPGFLALIVGVPLHAFAIVLTFMLAPSKSMRGNRLAFVIFLMICVMAYVLGVKLLARQGKQISSHKEKHSFYAVNFLLKCSSKNNFIPKGEAS